MSTGSDFGSDILDWIADTIAYQGAGSGIWRPLPKIEAKDGLEPSVVSLREEARQADAKLRSKSKTLSSVDKKALDKEFWDVM